MKREAQMIIVSDLHLPLDAIEGDVCFMAKKTLKRLGIYPSDPEMHIFRRSVDARRRSDIHFVYSVAVTGSLPVGVLEKIGERRYPHVALAAATDPTVRIGDARLPAPPVIVGAGPAGLFCALMLAENGYEPILLERGGNVEERKAAVADFWEHHLLDPETNIQFGAGGAGTFSDGKLVTRVNDPLGAYVLRTLVRFGAPDEILTQAKPHIGTDILGGVVSAMLREVKRLGGSVRYHTRLDDMVCRGDAVSEVVTNRGDIPAGALVLATGHSARDTFEMLHKTGLFMEPKAFAVGFRVEHPQRDINCSQYGEKYAELLEAAPYKVTANLANGRGVYSFCMCPGGYVVNASSEEKRLAVNGMSYSDRGSNNANSAIIVSVTPDDFEGTDALSGVEFQRRLEEKAFALGNGKIPQQLFGDYCENKKSTGYGKIGRAHV